MFQRNPMWEGVKIDTISPQKAGAHFWIKDISAKTMSKSFFINFLAKWSFLSKFY
jgi:hypothetical protein